MSDGSLTGGGWRPTKVAAEDTETKGGHRPRPSVGTESGTSPRPPSGGGGVSKPPSDEEKSPSPNTKPR